MIQSEYERLLVKKVKELEKENTRLWDLLNSPLLDLCSVGCDEYAVEKGLDCDNCEEILREMVQDDEYWEREEYN